MSLAFYDITKKSHAWSGISQFQTPSACLIYPCVQDKLILHTLRLSHMARCVSETSMSAWHRRPSLATALTLIRHVYLRAVSTWSPFTSSSPQDRAFQGLSRISCCWKYQPELSGSHGTLPLVNGPREKLMSRSRNNMQANLIGNVSSCCVQYILDIIYLRSWLVLLSDWFMYKIAII